MCGSCWDELGRPTLFDQDVKRAVGLVRRLYELEPTGGPLHAELDDWNVNGESIKPMYVIPAGGPRRTRQDRYSPEVHRVADELAGLLTEMTVGVRGSVLAHAEGFAVGGKPVAGWSDWVGPPASATATWAPFHGLRMRVTRTGTDRYVIEAWHGTGWRHATVGFTAAGDERANLIRDLAEATVELAELRGLFDLQSNRMTEVIALWRAETPGHRDHALPDLGRLLEWLMARGVAAERSGYDRAVAVVQRAFETARREVIQRPTDRAGRITALGRVLGELRDRRQDSG